MKLRYRASLGLWWRWCFGRFWVGPFATAHGAATMKLSEHYTDAQRQAWRNRR